MAAFLQIYTQALNDAIAHYIGQSGTDELVSRLARHHVEAVSWLTRHAHPGLAATVESHVPAARVATPTPGHSRYIN
jgi:hypothetical protein